MNYSDTISRLYAENASLSDDVCSAARDELKSPSGDWKSKLVGEAVAEITAGLAKIMEQNASEIARLNAECERLSGDVLRYQNENAELGVELEALRGQKPDDYGWIPWLGGKCPVTSGTVVDYKLRPSCIVGWSFFTDHAENLSWNHTGKHSDIVAYRVSKGGAV